MHPPHAPMSAGHTRPPPAARVSALAHQVLARAGACAPARPGAFRSRACPPPRRADACPQGRAARGPAARGIRPPGAPAEGPVVREEAAVDDDGGRLHGRVRAVAAHDAQQSGNRRRGQRRAAQRHQVAHLARLRGIGLGRSGIGLPARTSPPPACSSAAALRVPGRTTAQLAGQLALLARVRRHELAAWPAPMSLRDKLSFGSAWPLGGWPVTCPTPLGRFFATRAGRPQGACTDKPRTTGRRARAHPPARGPGDAGRRHAQRLAQLRGHPDQAPAGVAVDARERRRAERPGLAQPARHRAAKQAGLLLRAARRACLSLLAPVRAAAPEPVLGCLHWLCLTKGRPPRVRRAARRAVPGRPEPGRGRARAGRRRAPRRGRRDTPPGTRTAGGGPQAARARNRASGLGVGFGQGRAPRGAAAGGARPRPCTCRTPSSPAPSRPRWASPRPARGPPARATRVRRQRHSIGIGFSVATCNQKRARLHAGSGAGGGAGCAARLQRCEAGGHGGPRERRAGPPSRSAAAPGGALSGLRPALFLGESGSTIYTGRTRRARSKAAGCSTQAGPPVLPLARRCTPEHTRSPSHPITVPRLSYKRTAYTACTQPCRTASLPACSSYLAPGRLL